MSLIDDIKRDRSRPRLTENWRVCIDARAPGWVEVLGAAFPFGAPTTATNLNGEDYIDRHRDARRAARVPDMEAALMAAEDCASALEAAYTFIFDEYYQSNRDDGECLPKEARGPVDKIVNALADFRKATEAK